MTKRDAVFLGFISVWTLALYWNALEIRRARRLQAMALMASEIRETLRTGNQVMSVEEARSRMGMSQN